MRDWSLGLAGRPVVVTGGGQGIGEAVAALMSRAGASVAVWDLQRDAGEWVAAQLRAQGQSAQSFVVDVRDPAAVEVAKSQTVDALGPIAVLVNNAWPETSVEEFLSTDSVDWARQFAGIEGILHSTRAFLPSMCARGWGRVINLGSVAGEWGAADMAVYSAAKAAVAGFTRALAKEVASRGVTVNCVAPGSVDTPRQRAREPELRAQRMRQIPTGRYATAEEIAAAVVFFASDHARYITGEVLAVDGGRP